MGVGAINSGWVARVRERLALAPDDLLRDRVYRRLWLSILTAAFANQVMLLALPLTAAVLLHASPTEMGLLTAAELTPFIALSLPSGVWLDRVRKLPVYLVGLLLGAVHTVSGSAAQVVLTQVVGRERLVQAHAKNALANSGAEVIGPGIAGLLIKVLGAPVSLLINACLLLGSALILRGLPLRETLNDRPDSSMMGESNIGSSLVGSSFVRELWAGLQFVARHRLLMTLAVLMGVWQMAHYVALTVQILFATRTLGLSEQAIGFSYAGMGLGTIVGSLVGHRWSHRFGPGPCLVLGYAVTGAGWGLLALAPVGFWGVAAFAVMLMSFSAGAIFIFINFLALRQSVTPAPMLGRMTSTMRWLSLLAAGPGALIGCWLGEHVSLRASLSLASASALVLAWVAWSLPAIRGLKALPSADPQAQAA